MSSVLMGIIGVVLFIGLALAGALFLGDAFRTSNASVTAATIASQLKQISDAVDMYKLETGRAHVPATEVDFLVPRFLKSVPVNPSAAAQGSDDFYFYKPRLSVWLSGYVNDASSASARLPSRVGRFVIAIIGPTSDVRAKAVCQAMARTFSGGVVSGAYEGYADPQPPEAAGCLVNAGASNSDDGDGYDSYYIAWRRIEVSVA